MRIVHISDLHFPISLNPITLRRKSLIGYVNYAFRRKKKHQLHHALIESISRLDYDCLVVSGDLTNVSQDKEFVEARKILDPILDHRTFMIPGNHDRYTRRSIVEGYYEQYFGEFSGDPVIPDTLNARGQKRYLRCKKFGDFAFYGWDSSVPLPPMQAQGYVEFSILEATLRHVEESNIREYALVCHHPIWNPRNRQESDRHRLMNRDELIAGLAERPPTLFLHGHLHTNWVKEPDSRIPYYVVNSASSTRDPDLKHQSGYHILTWNPSAQDAKESWGIVRMVHNLDQGQFIEENFILC